MLLELFSLLIARGRERESQTETKERESERDDTEREIAKGTSESWRCSSSSSRASLSCLSIIPGTTRQSFYGFMPWLIERQVDSYQAQ